MLHLASETDFVARSLDFCKFLDEELRIFLDAVCDCIEDVPGFSERLVELIGKVKENIVVKGAYKCKADETVSFYQHGSISNDFPTITSIGAIVKLNRAVDAKFMKEMAMHVVAFKPKYVVRSVHDDVALYDQAFLTEQSITVKNACDKRNVEISEFCLFSVK
jgi:translation elongation factor EF-Ts